MIKTVTIDSIDALMPLITEQTYLEGIDRYRSFYLYRGMTDDFQLETSLYRNCKSLAKVLEPSILKNFTKYAAIEDPTVATSVWRQLILGQHYGLPTRLLDWSHSALIALHFACTEPNLDDMEAHDCVIWRLDMREMFDMLPEKYKLEMNNTSSFIFPVDKLMKVAPDLESFDRDMNGQGMVVIEPPSIDPRIVNQYSFFTVVPDGMGNINDYLNESTSNTIKYVIKASIRWDVRDMLDKLNISERMVYPGLDGLTKWLGRHYYVKDSIL
ncbi:MAG: FRG domain-containing protein [Clostridia bacterium]|nr:FRG domain-containing protein [Clostridia bacterium]